MPKTQTLPHRRDVRPADAWDLSSLFPADEAWEKAFTKWEGRIAGYARHQGKLAQGPKRLAAALRFDADFERAAERLGTYAHLKTTEDQANSTYQRMLGRYRSAASRAAQAASYLRPEILAISPARMKRFLAAKELVPYRTLLERLLRFRPHTLSEREENLLAMQ
ncbi:MAG: oligoendopeptidase F, partial [Pirellulales bacterium]